MKLTCIAFALALAFGVAEGRCAAGATDLSIICVFMPVEAGRSQQTQLQGGPGSRPIADGPAFDAVARFRANIDRSMMKVFRQNGIRVLSLDELCEASEGKLVRDDLLKDVWKTSDFSAKNRREVVHAVRNLAEPTLVALGTFAIGPKRTESPTGETSVDVLVDATVINCRDHLTEIVASIGHLRVTTAGTNDFLAERAALEMAAERAAAELVSQLIKR